MVTVKNPMAMTATIAMMKVNFIMKMAFLVYILTDAMTTINS